MFLISIRLNDLSFNDAISNNTNGFVRVFRKTAFSKI